MPLLKRIIAIISGSLLLSAGINLFLSPYHVLDGGVIGIGLIVHYLWGIQVGLTIILFSLPIYVLAWFRYRSYFYNSLHGMLISSFFIDVFGSTQSIWVPYIHFSAIVNAIVGGTLIGSGIGWMLRYRTSTGGTDLLAQFISEFFKWNVGVVIFFIDTVVITLGGILISPDTFFLSVLTITSVGVMTTLWTRQKKLVP